MNRLAQETSPYLRQHAGNPVDWYPWGEEALARARAQDRPLLVSIGYSACHWCHVMAHESFEDPQVAALMNDRFVCVKVDREERPDIDAVCMAACQTMTGHGGWPLNVFLTPEQEPFFAGTYFPPAPRPGMPSWRMVLEAIDEAWRERREQVREQGARLAGALAASASPTRVEAAHVPRSAVTDTVQALGQMFDRVHGGWGGAPKFPPHCVLEFLLAAGDAELAPATLHAMADGGIYDHVGGGFARYAVDATWTVPHFEKMLYDNALLARAYLHGWQVTREPRFRDVCHETLDWALRELRGPEGAFCAALDADSEGVEGRYYVWTTEQLTEAVGPELAAAARAYFCPPGASPNFEGTAWVLEAHGSPPEELAEIRRRLLAARERRVRPGLDDKRLTAWNALMIAALADAGAALDRPDYLEAARACADFLLRELRDDENQLLRTWKEGRASLPAYLEDHAYLLQALLVLYEATFDERWYVEAVALADAMIDRFADAESDGFFTTAAGTPHLVSRRKDLEDTPAPSGNSAAALGLLRLARLSGDASYERHATGVLALHAEMALRHPLAFGHLLQALDLYLATPREVAIVGAGPLTGALRTRHRPHLVLAGTDANTTEGTAVALLRGRGPVDGRQAAYVCERFACQLPVTELDALEALLA
ncbi:MAG TPA: thioredoxin domain-containing protein [Solirubrobacteraceae bacterium]|nr:thioredoxin domain-containing protein [Solirubrobacteraceae bacterium]